MSGSESTGSRKLSDEVNPLISVSETPINGNSGNYIICKRKRGAYVDITGGGLPFPGRITDPAVLFFEVSKKRYPFTLTFDAPSSQVSFTFRVMLEFELWVTDPIFVAKERVDGLLADVRTDLKRLVCNITGRYEVHDSQRVMQDVQMAVDSYKHESFIGFKSGVAYVSLVGDAARYMKEIEEREIAIKLEDVKRDVGIVSATGRKAVEIARDSVEEHQVVKQMKSLTGREE